MNLFCFAWETVTALFCMQTALYFTKLPRKRNHLAAGTAALQSFRQNTGSPLTRVQIYLRV